MFDEPAEADKSFLLPLTSSILRAHKLISEPDLEASPFAQNNKINGELEENTFENVGFSVWQKSDVTNLPLNTDPNHFLVKSMDTGKF